MKRHFTATAYIIEFNKVLLLFHKKLNKWLPPGGHLEVNETPEEAVLREVKEETGLEVDLICDEQILINQWNAKSFPRPYMCLLENIPAYGKEEAHQHMDMIYLAKPRKKQNIPSTHQHETLRWFSLEEVEKLESDKDIFYETKQTLRRILNQAHADTYH